MTAWLPAWQLASCLHTATQAIKSCLIIAATDAFHQASQPLLGLHSDLEWQSDTPGTPVIPEHNTSLLQCSLANESCCSVLHHTSAVVSALLPPWLTKEGQSCCNAALQQWVTCVDEAGAAEAGHGGLHQLGGQGPGKRMQGLHPGQLTTLGAQLNLCHYALVIGVQVPVAVRCGHVSCYASHNVRCLLQ